MKIDKIIGKITIGNKEFPIVYIHKKRYQRYTYYRFKEDKFVVSSFYKINEKEVIEKVKEFAYKLVKKGVINEDIINEKINNEFVYILGNKYFINKVNNSIIFKEKVIKIDKNYYKNLINLVYDDVFNSFEYYRKLMNIPPIYKLSFRNMKTRLGTNSRKTNKITLSYDLLSYSLTNISSVIVHELAHYYYFDHSKNFYNIIYRYLPNYDILTKNIKRRIYKND